jgi:general secretion pathway protein K
MALEPPAMTSENHRSRRRRSRRSERGAALLLVIWIFIVLFVLVLDFASSMRDDGFATANFADETQAYYIALGGLNRAVYDVLVSLEDNPDIFLDSDDEEGEEDDATVGEAFPEDTELDELDELDEDVSDDFSDILSGAGSWVRGTFGDGTYAVRIVDEGGKISLNKAGEPLLTRVIRRLVVGGNATEGVSVKEEREVGSIVHAIMDWRDPDDLENLNGAEGDYYASLPQPYAIKDGDFDAVDELLLVKGVTPDLFYGADGGVGLRDVFSVFNRSSKINVMRAPAPVLRVLFDLDEESVAELVAEREEESFGFVQRMREMMLAIDPQLAPLLRAGMSPLVTVEAHGELRERTLSRVAAIVDLSDSFDGARIFRWVDRIPAGWTAGGGSDADEMVEGEEEAL